MENKAAVNYQRELDGILNKLDEPKKILLHSCCAPCSSYVIEYLSDYMEITVIYYNPNITDGLEYLKRKREQIRFIDILNSTNAVKYPVRIMDCEYNANEFYDAIRGFEEDKEGGDRCYLCFELRLDKTARVANEYKFDYYATTLTISPMKSALIINEIGNEMAEKYNINWLPSDFKKKNGFKRSIELSKEYGLYRQDYCGCGFSKLERQHECMLKMS